MNNDKYLFYFLSFLEGASVMAAELLGAKMLAPFFGSSLYVWSSVLGITLGGLALGYFTGGIISQKANAKRNLFVILLLSAIFLIVMPMLARTVMIHTAGFSFLISILFSSVIFLFPPVFFMGMVSPLIVQCVNAEQPGKAAGTVFAISTLGGIISTFLLGFYLIPHFGLSKPALAIGIILGIIPFLKLITGKKFFSLLFLLAAFVAFSNSKVPPLQNGDARILYSSEGLLGQVVVADYPYYENSKKTGTQRILFMNRSLQTIVTRKNGSESYFDYVNLIGQLSGDGSCLNKKALVLGLGGGSVANVLVKNGFSVDAVELDARMAECAKEYFNMNDKVNIEIDDARHAVHQPSAISHQSYDIIVLDAFVGEVNPHHLFTKEFFSELKPLLSDSGIFFINGNGYWNGEAGKGMRAICKTLLASGFDVNIIPTREEEEYRNLVFEARKTKNGSGDLASEKIHDLSLNDAVVLEDEKPRLEILNVEANKRWREACLHYFLRGYYSGQDKLIFQ